MEQPVLDLTYTLATINDAAQQFWKKTQDYKILAFSGEMGAGKTTFIHHLCEILKVEDTVSSPTFALINEYHFNKNGDQTIYHLDWYRLRDAAEAVNAGMEDCLLQATKGMAYCFVEWPEKAIELLQPPYLWIAIATAEDITKRTMQIKAIL